MRLNIKNICTVASTTLFFVACAPPAENSIELNKYPESSSSLSDSATANPLPVQMESMYVTDQSRWGQLIFDRTEIDGSYSSTKETAELASFIESYHRH